MTKMGSQNLADSMNMSNLGLYRSELADKGSVFVTDLKDVNLDEVSKMFKKNGYDILTIDFRKKRKASFVSFLETTDPKK